MGMDNTTVLDRTRPLREYVAEEILGWLGKRRMSVAELGRRLGHANDMQLFRRLNAKLPFTTKEVVQIAAILRVPPRALLPADAAPPAAAGPGKPIDLDQLEHLAAVLGIPPAQLIDDLSGFVDVPKGRYPSPAERSSTRPRDRRPPSHPAGPPSPERAKSTRAVPHPVGLAAGQRRTGRVTPAPAPDGAPAAPGRSISR
jgi:hypothetical protein